MFNLRNRRWGGCVYVLQMFFFCFFFRSPQKYQTTDLGNGWTDFHETFTKRFQRRNEMGVRPPNNSLGVKIYTLRTWWWRLASDWELVCWLWHCAATAVALKRHERANTFNLVYFVSRWIQNAGPEPAMFTDSVELFATRQLFMNVKRLVSLTSRASPLTGIPKIPRNKSAGHWHWTSLYKLWTSDSLLTID